MDLNSGRVVTTLPVHGKISRLAFTPGEKGIVIQRGTALANAPIFQAGDNSFELWDIAARSLVCEFSLPISRLTGAAISRIGNVILADHYSANEYSPEKGRFSGLDFLGLGEPGGGARDDKEVIIVDATSGAKLAAIRCDDNNLVAADCDYSSHWCATGHAYCEVIWCG